MCRYGCFTANLNLIRRRLQEYMGHPWIIRKALTAPSTVCSLLVLSLCIELLQEPHLCPSGSSWKHIHSHWILEGLKLEEHRRAATSSGCKATWRRGEASTRRVCPFISSVIRMVCDQELLPPLQREREMLKYFDKIFHLDPQLNRRSRILGCEGRVWRADCGSATKTPTCIK